MKYFSYPMEGTSPPIGYSHTNAQRFSVTPAFRKLYVTAHVSFSVGWLGAVVGFLALSIVGLTSQDPEIVRAAYLAMKLTGELVIVPLSLAALATGLVLSLGTSWGLFRYYWVLVKFVLTLIAATALLLHQFLVVTEAARRVSGAAAGAHPDVGRLGIQLAMDAGLAVALLLVITAIGVYKPWGRTHYGQRKRRSETPGTTPATAARTVPNARPGWTGGIPLGLKICLAILGAIMAAFLLLHLAGGGLGNHAR